MDDMGKRVWNDDLTAELRRRWIDNQSQSEIGAAFGMSRSAIGGRLHRLRATGEKFQHETIMPPHLSKDKPPPVRKLRREPSDRQPPAAITVIERIPLDRLDRKPLQSRHCSLLQLTATRCRWPIGDPRDKDFCYCGGKVAAGYPYCHAHCHLAYGLTRQPLRPYVVQARKP